MIIQVNQELCAGCGVCVEACSVGAIQLVNQRAVIDGALCTACGACVEACPNEAITSESIVQPNTSIVKLPASESPLVPIRDRAAQLEKTAPALGMATLAGTALAYLGREVAPRLVDVLVAALERRLARPATTAITPLSTSPMGFTRKGRGRRKQIRNCGRRNGNRNPIERR